MKESVAQNNFRDSANDGKSSSMTHNRLMNDTQKLFKQNIETDFRSTTSRPTSPSVLKEIEL